MIRQVLGSKNSRLAVCSRLVRAALTYPPITISFALLLVFLLGSALRAEHTRSWRQSSYEEFLKGTPEGVAVRSDGRLELAPKFSPLADAAASYLWSLRVDAKGVLYAAAGSPAKVFRFGTDNKPTTVFESTDLSAQAIAFDSKGLLYVATSPDGKVYRISPSGEKSVFFEPQTKYIWDLGFAPDGTLFIATGDKGQIFCVSPDGKGALFYASDEAHIRVLSFDTQGNVLAGTEPNGRILRITRNTGKPNSAGSGEGFVLYETPKREVTALAVAPDGKIYASAIGEKQRGAVPVPPISTAPQVTITVPGPTPTVTTQPQSQTPFLPFPPAISSSIYSISSDGAHEELWNSRDDVVYALALPPDGRLLAGTGNKGALIAIDGRGIFAQLAKAAASQITGIARGAGGKIFLCTANPGKVFSLGPDYEPEGSYTSRSFDARLFSQWGRLDWWSSHPTAAANEPEGTGRAAPKAAANNDPRIEFFVRSGNTEDPGKEWSHWFGPYAKPGRSVEAPAARFVQWKAVIRGGRPGDGLDWVGLAFLPRNVAPEIDAIALQDPGVRVQGSAMVPSGQQQTANLRLPQVPNSTGVTIGPGPGPAKFEVPPQGFFQKGYLSVLWSAHDDNDDELHYSVYFRGERETTWKLLKDKLDQKFYSWDSTTMPDGAYYLKIVATDAPSNPPAAALTGERESERFVVDNTAPVIEHLQASVSASRAGGGKSESAVVQFTARDATSSIERAQYSVDGGDWILVVPIGHISDAREERYEVAISTPLAPGEHTVAVRAYDSLENVGTAKTTLQVPGPKP